MKVTGKGSIQSLEPAKPKSRCRRWRLFVRTDMGKKTRTVHGTWTQAQEALKEFMAELGESTGYDGTFGQWADLWRKWRAQSGDIQAATAYNDKTNLAVVCEHVGDVPLEKLTPDKCRKALVEMREGRSGTYMNKIYCTWKMCLEMAVDDGKIARNPLDKIKAPRIDTEEKKWLSPEELARFIAKVRDMPRDGRTMALLYMAGLGLRRGEAVALLEDDVDLVTGVCSVRRAYKELTGEVGDTKTESGARELPMPRWLVDDTREWVEEKRALGWPKGYVCCNTYGKLLRTQNLWKWWAKRRDALGCPGFGLHQLRHSCLSLMARHASVFDLQRFAGWSSIAPAKTYVHADFSSLAAAVDGAFDCIDGASRAHFRAHFTEKAGQTSV